MHSEIKHNREELDIAVVQALLEQQGYDLVERYGHVHAIQSYQEYHICLITQLSTMNVAQFLACLQDTLAYSLPEDELQRIYKNARLASMRSRSAR